MSKEVKSSWINIRLTPALLEKIKAEAEQEHRTISSQSIYIIEQYFKSKEK